jgi:hypothetical protein
MRPVPSVDYTGVSAERSLRLEPSLPGAVADFRTMTPETWLAQGHEPLSVREAARRVGVSETTMRRRLRERTPRTGATTALTEAHGTRFAAQRSDARYGRRWTVYLLGPAGGLAHGGPGSVAELRSRMVADEAASTDGHRWWRFAR